jgi:hypothetical protein
MSRLTPAEQAQLDGLIARRRALIRQINDATRDLERTQRELRTVEDRLRLETDPAAKDVLAQKVTQLQQQEKQQDATLNRLNQELDEVERQIDLLQSPRPGQTAQGSAAVAVGDDAAAAAEGARTQNPVLPEQSLADNEEIVDTATLNRPDTNANQPELANNEELGLVDGASTVGGSAPVRTTVQTQPGAATPPDDARETASTSVGVSTGSTAEGRPPVAREFVDPINATPNLLAKLASMTYTASIYLLNPGEYLQLLQGQRKTLPPSTSLIIQSGGISQSNVRGTGTRNPYFDVDFYIDNIKLESLVTGKAGVGAHTSFSLDFTITEPYGITFLPRLKAAVTNHLGASETVNELSQNFLMVIRFYGYDDQGTMINGANLGVEEARSDFNAVVEKWIPFQLASVTYRIQNKVTEYSVKATVVDTSVAYNTAYASIPFNFELTADTVQALLNGKATLTQRGQDLADEVPRDGQTPVPPPKAAAIPSKSTYIGGLCDALNQHEENIRKKKGYEIANRYIIELEDVPGLKDAKVARPGRPDKSSSAMNTNQEAAAKYLGSKTSYQADMKNFSVVAGTQIVQLIDMVMRTSSYITSQQNIIYDPKTGVPTNQTPVSTVQWYRIRSECKPIGYDKKRLALAYEIKYLISRYQINDPRSAYFPQARYRGAHKRYDYWFTGKNSELLDFQIDVNTQFFVNIGNDGKTAPPQPNAQFQVRNVFNTQTGQSQQPGPNPAGLPAANLADRLYAPTDVAQIKVEILGDPGWIQQSEVFYKGVNLSPFVQDNSVNFDASEVLFEINFNPATDYDLFIGIMDVQNRNQRNQSLFRPAPQKSVFSAFQVTSNFRQGRFTQELQGTIIDFDIPTDTAADPNQSAAETARLNRQPGVRNTGAPVPVFEVTASPGLLDLELGNTNGAINYRPRGLAQVLDAADRERAISTASPKPGTEVVADDAISNNPFAGSA